MKHPFLLITLFMICSCSRSIVAPFDLTSQNWIHGSENCEENIDPPIQVVKYNNSTYILRQSKCTNYEAPFMFLFIGKKKALLMDTGASEAEDIFLLYDTIIKIINDQSKKRGDIELVVAHTHKHGDHFAADGQFKRKSNTTVLGLEVSDIKSYFNISRWPQEIVNFNLGKRNLKIIPIPGHEASSIAVYDSSTKILLTGDTFYPGRLYVEDWKAFKNSIERLVKFTDTNEISTILGNHIEMTDTPGVDYPIGTIYQPNEHPLPLSVAQLTELSDALKKLGNTPTREVFDSFIIFPVN